MRRELILFVLLCCSVMWISCGKEKAEKPSAPAKFPKVKIDAVLRLGFDDISITASYENEDNETVIKKGFCWSTTQNPVVSDHKSEITPSGLFADTIFDAGQKATIYFRAYLQTADSVYYSENAMIATGGLDGAYLGDINDGRWRHIWQVIETSDNHLLQFIQVVGNGLTWLQIVKLDYSGNVLWKQDYYSGERKYTDEIMEVTGGYIFVATSIVNLEEDLILARIDHNGVKGWEKTFKKKKNQEFLRTKLLPNNQVMLTMIAYDDVLPTGRTNCSIEEVIVDLAGNIISEKTVAYDNKITRQGGTWVGLNVMNEGFSMASHYTDPNSSVYDQLAVQKINAANQLEWEKLYVKAKVNGPSAMSLNATNDYDILALFEEAGRQKTWLMQLDGANGNKKWEFIFDTNKYGSPVTASGLKLYRDPTGNLYVFGKITDPANPDVNLFVLKVTGDGKKVWSHSFKIPTTWPTGPEAIIVKGKEIYLFGSIYAQVPGSNPLFMTKLIEN